VTHYSVSLLLRGGRGIPPSSLARGGLNMALTMDNTKIKIRIDA
jgi:hypothetical protein